jgi:molybdopterin-binding protein
MEIVSVITKTSAENMGLAQGSEVYAVIKASNVMIAVD